MTKGELLDALEDVSDDALIALDDGNAVTNVSFSFTDTGVVVWLSDGEEE